MTKYTPHPSMTGQKRAGYSPRLHQRVIGAAENRLGPSEGVDFTSASRLPCIEILQKPIAFAMQAVNVLQGHHMLLLQVGVCLLLRLEFALRSGLGSLLIIEGLRILGTFGGGFRHHLRVVTLGILLVSGGHRHLLVQISDEKVDHRDDTLILLMLRGVCTECLWGWRRG